MNKKIFLKPLIIAVVSGVLFLCAFYFLKKYDDKIEANGFKHEEESYIATYRVRYQNDTGGAASPEECYESFKSAMLEHNLDKALSFIFIDERPKYEYQLGQYLKEGKSYEDIADVLPKDIEKSAEYEWGDEVPFKANLKEEVWEGTIVENGENFSDSVTFVKTFNNKWQIESF